MIGERFFLWSKRFNLIEMGIVLYYSFEDM